MYAVIETGGKQYQVKANDTLFIEKLNVEAEDSIVFDKVVAVGGEDGLKIGTPYGHRQPYTQVQIEAIEA